jgi:hypothetical protein
MGKRLCKEGDKKESGKVKDLKYRCKSCGAEANKEKQLCKPKKN